MIRSLLRRYGPELLVVAGAASVIAAAGFRWVTPLGDHGIWFSNLQAFSRGARLMRDIRYPYGPLSVVVLDALTRPLGQRVWSVAAIQFVLGLAAAIAIVRFSRRYLSIPELWMASALLVNTVFWIPGEGSLLYPYAPAVSIGFLFAIAALAMALRAVRCRSVSLPVVISGVLGGLAYLTKQEIGAAAAVGVAAAWLSACRPVDAVKRGLLAGIAFLGTVAVGYAIVFRGLPFLETARANVLWPFSPVPPSWRAQYAGVTGADHPIDSALGVVAAAGAIVAVIAAVAAMIEWGRRRPRAAGVTVLLAGAAAIAASRSQRIAPFAAVPVGVAAALVLGCKTRKGQGSPALLALAAASVPLLTRVGWRGWSDGPFTAIGYSFAIPVVVFAGSRLFHALVSPSAEGMEDRRRTAAVVVVIAATLGLAMPALLRIGRWPEPSVPVAMPRGTVWVPESWARALGRVRDYVLAKTTPADPVMFLPETHGMNFLVGRDGSAPGAKLDTGWDRTSDSGLIRMLIARPPALIVIFDESAQPFSTAGFGTVYGQALLRWIETRYRRALVSSGHGISFQIFAGPEIGVGRQGKGR